MHVDCWDVGLGMISAENLESGPQGEVSQEKKKTFMGPLGHKTIQLNE